ncbi:hypothetical protein [Streptomyces spiramyceticus]|uniref:hypothetical protein n=1 Tax=Streptomyces spiramyceticus TaxID=299717 RepID=UPI00237A8BA6|nr:hypothetical protein [Streptomyces spiramyceticus]
MSYLRSLWISFAQAISACAAAYAAGGEQQGPALRRASRRLGAVTQGLRAAHRHRSSVPRLSHRRKALRAHERQVVAVLRNAEARLDSEPQQALRELGELLLTIADRYCQAGSGHSWTPNR